MKTGELNIVDDKRNDDIFTKNITSSCENQLKEPESSTFKYSMWSALVFLSFSLLFMVAFSVYISLRLHKMKAFLSEADVKQFRKGRLQRTKKGDAIIDGVVCGENIKVLKFDREHELTREEITIDKEKILGFGNFGIVYKGTAKGVPAAIKMPNGNCTKGTFKTFLSEVKVLCFLGMHPNILEFFGAHVKEIRRGILHIATELCSNGCLESFLRKKKHVMQRNCAFDPDIDAEEVVSLYELHKFSLEIAKGMEYISSKKVVHGDLSTRNVFLDYENVCKIGDFGLSRKLQEYEMYMKNSYDPIPWKWMAYESLTRREFTCKSDVWSYGVTVWEIFSLGTAPYAGLSWAPTFATALEEGLRLPFPAYATAEIYKRLNDCWNLDPKKRTTCSSMLNFFKGYCDSEYVVLELPDVDISSDDEPFRDQFKLDEDATREYDTLDESVLVNIVQSFQENIGIEETRL